jgi:hypothetical protein
MNKLDGDGALLRSGNRVAKRDIVQFVPFIEASRNGVLSEQVLAEMPGQVEEFAMMTGFKPNPQQQILSQQLLGKFMTNNA